MRARSFVPAGALAVLAVAAGAAPAAVPTPSSALFTDSRSLVANTATAAPCPSSTTWSTRVNASFTGAAREQWQTLDTATSAVPNDRWYSDNWSESSLVTNQPGALYCSSDRGISLDAATDKAVSPSKTYATWSASGTVTTILWVKGTSSAAGRLITLAEGASGGSTYAERALWVTATGGLAAGGRYATSGSWTTTTSDVVVTDGRWHLIVVVWTNTATVTDEPTIYLDGAPTSTTTTGSVRYRARASSGTTAAWYVGANAAGRLPTGAPTSAYLGGYDEFVVVAGTPAPALLGRDPGSLVAAADG